MKFVFIFVVFIALFLAASCEGHIDNFDWKVKPNTEVYCND